MMLQPAKCSFCKPNFEILGFIAMKDGLKPNPKKVEAIQNYPLPTTPKEVKRFLGMVTWLKRFIPRSFSLTTHLRKAKVMDPKKFSLSQKSIKEIHLLKELLTSKTCIAHPDFSKEFFIHVDASKLGLGAILTQMDQNGRHRVIEYASRTLTKTQQKYTNPLQEALESCGH